MSQNPTVLPITGTFNGLTEQGYINGAMDTLNTKWSGASAPSSPELGQDWLNNTSSTLQIHTVYDGANWLPKGVIDTSNSIWTPPVGGGLTPTISSAATTDLGSKPQARKFVSGTTTITSFGSSAVVGTLHFVKFTGALSITAGANILTLSGSSMSVSAGDDTIWTYNGSGIWQLVYWSSSSALPSIASHRILANTTGSTAQPSANTISQVLDLAGATNGTVPYRSGGAWASTGISAILDAILGSTVGGVAVRGTSAWTQTGVGTSGQALTSNGTGIAPTFQTFTGKLVQELYDENTNYLQDTVGGFAFNDTIPQQTSGTECLTQTITPTSATNNILIWVTAMIASASSGRTCIALFQDSTANALDCSFGSTTTVTTLPMTLIYRMVAGTTSSTTFKVRFGEPNANGAYLNGNSGGRIGGGSSRATIAIFELAP